MVVPAMTRSTSRPSLENAPLVNQPMPQGMGDAGGKVLLEADYFSHASSFHIAEQGVLWSIETVRRSAAPFLVICAESCSPLIGCRDNYL